MKMLSIAALAASILIAGGVSAGAKTKAEMNKETVIAFYNALSRGDTDTLQKLGRPDYRQHNPNYGDTLQGLIDNIKARPPRDPSLGPVPPLEFVRIIADDTYVVTLRKMAPPMMPAGYPQYPADAQRANVDIFRVQDGKVAEHWDYQETFPRAGAPNPPKNPNGAF